MRRMWISLLTRFSAPSKRETIGDILSRPEAGEDILGMRKIVPPTHDRMVSDAGKLVRHSNSADYEIWAKEVWAKAADIIDRLTDPRTPQAQAEFERGRLASILECLRLSEKTRILLDNLKSQENGTVKKT